MSSIGGIIYQFCSVQCHQRSDLQDAETIDRNMQVCAKCTKKNAELMSVLSGGPVPAEEADRTASGFRPTSVLIEEERMIVGGYRAGPRTHDNKAFYRFLRSRQATNWNSRQLALDSANKWRMMSENEKARFKEPTFFQGEAGFVAQSH